MVQFNEAINFAEGAQRVDTLRDLKGLENNQYYNTALGDFYALLKDVPTAKIHYENAIQLMMSKAEWHLIWEKIEGVP